MTKSRWPSLIVTVLAAAGLIVTALMLTRDDNASEAEAAIKKRPWILLAIGALAIAALVVIAVFARRHAAAGWLLGFTYIAGFPLGSLALLMIHRLTGGRWGEALEPFLRPLALTTPLLLLFVVPVLIASPVLFPWQHGANGDVTHSVRLIYLNLPSYAARSLVALAGWSLLAYTLPGPQNRAAPLIAGVGLVFYGIVINFIGLDWVLAAEPVFFSTSFGASVAFTELLSALALTALVAPRDHEFSDLGALMLVVTLGITYTDFMATLVIWYGDVPSKVFWFVERVREPWLALAVAAFVVTSLIPVALLMFARVRASRVALCFVGACNLIGLALYQSWLLAPAFGVAALGAALLASIAMAALLAAAIAGGWMETLFYRWSLAHGR